jgi:hypothetical protein
LFDQRRHRDIRPMHVIEVKNDALNILTIHV